MKIENLLALALSAAVAVLSACGSAEMAERPATTVSVGTVALRAVAGGQRYTASIEPDTQVSLAFRTNGYVKRIAQTRGVDGRSRALPEGDFVRRGTVLAVVRQGDYTVKVDQGKSQVAEAEAGYERAVLDFGRAKALYESQSMTKPDYDAAKAQVDMAKAKLDAAKAQVGVVRARVGAASAQVREASLVLQDTALVAPMDCLVLRRTIEVGSLVAAGAEGFVVADTSSVKAVFGVPDVAVSTLAPGKVLTVTTEALPGQVFTGQVSSVAPSADAKSRVFDIKVTIPNPGQALKSGMIASLVVADAAVPEQLPVVPLNAVVRARQNPEGYAVYVVEDSVVHEREVSLGAVFGGDIVVTGGVRVGDQVVVTGATLVTDGEKVRVLK
jgi:multidrug efflux system membrane fusion protein